jgi:hypothetical protein
MGPAMTFHIAVMAALVAGILIIMAIDMGAMR